LFRREIFRTVFNSWCIIRIFVSVRQGFKKLYRCSHIRIVSLLSRRDFQIFDGGRHSSLSSTREEQILFKKRAKISTISWHYVYTRHPPAGGRYRIMGGRAQHLPGAFIMQSVPQQVYIFLFDEVFASRSISPVIARRDSSSTGTGSRHPSTVIPAFIPPKYR